MSYLPGGAEDSEDDDYLEDYSNYNEKSILKAEKPKPKVLIEANGTPILLNDIRMAVINGNLDYLKTLIEIESANTFFVDSILMAGWTPLMYGSNCGHKDIVHYLLERGADPNYHLDNFTPLMAVCTGSNDIEDNLIVCAQKLLKFGANVNALDTYGNSALIYAAKSGKSGLTQELIGSNAQINCQNNDGWSALHWAVREGYGKVIEKLLNNNIDITLKTSSNQIAADIAILKGHQKINEILDSIRERDSSPDTNGAENNGNQNRRLSDVEVTALENYVKPIVQIECQQKSKPKIQFRTDLEDFLSQTNYIYLLSAFEKHGFGYHDLVTNTEETLRKIGVEEISIIRKISSHIILIHRQDWKKDSLMELSLETKITSPNVLCILSNIANHLTRIDQTFLFLKNKLNKRPEILNENNDITTKEQISNEILQSLINTRTLFNEIQNFRNFIHSIEDFEEAKRSDVLSIPFSLEDQLYAEENNKQNKSSKYGRNLFVSLISVGVLDQFRDQSSQNYLIFY